MQVFVARQAIFNRRQHVVAYELLFRNSTANYFPDIEESVATAKLIMENQLNFGTRHITSGKKALINIGPDSLKMDLCAFLPSQDVVLELLETIEPTEENYQLCRALFHKNFVLALDDFVYEPKWERFLKLIKLIKFDIQITPLQQIAPLIKKLKKYNKLKLLAEKIETVDDFKTAHRMGFDYFQGYFFAKPVVIQQKDIDINYALALTIYAQVMKQNPDINAIARLFQLDTALAFKLLRLINSGVFPVQKEIESLKQALVYLGHDHIKKLVSLIITAHVAQTKPSELIKVCIIRARFCELIANRVAPSQANSAFLTGLFSLLDAILDRPMEQLLTRLPFPDSIKAALMQEKNTLYYILETVKAYESGSWWAMEQAVVFININSDLLPKFYRDALDWSNTHQYN
ncbi:HDOD domain-containing protein [Pseudoalteromonas sp. KG3]|uniref:HDOD domain-containing protein n=1 Tax=Pseudoalteromonas prydzensis TaxID=182141 RepID=A0ABR9FM77_9GAMM|nr:MULTISPECIES: HDOD domain-containing protein [Pseudoalteromonas]MBE0457914.1 HDOD domain-containing protein [Pseudoalteromonas prydzensis]WKD26169.1 HDOD domain-containing protein [Pseudoalteromonas sp. KG3]